MLLGQPRTLGLGGWSKRILVWGGEGALGAVTPLNSQYRVHPVEAEEKIAPILALARSIPGRFQNIPGTLKYVFNICVTFGNFQNIY